MTSMRKVSLLVGALGGAMAGYLFSNKKLRDQLAKADSPEEAAKLLGKHLQKDGKKIAKQAKEFIESEDVQHQIDKAKDFAQKQVTSAKKEFGAYMSSGSKKAKKVVKKGASRAKSTAKKATRKAKGTAKKVKSKAKKAVRR